MVPSCGEQATRLRKKTTWGRCYRAIDFTENTPHSLVGVLEYRVQTEGAESSQPADFAAELGRSAFSAQAGCRMRRM